MTINIRFLTLIVATRPNLQKTYHSWQHIVEIQMLYTKVKVHTTSVNQITDAHNFEQCTFIHPNQNHKICSEFMNVQLANSLLSSKESLSVGTPGPGYPLLLRLGKDSRSYPKLRAEEQSSWTPAVRSPPHRASGPGPALCSGEGPVTP